MSKQTSNCSNYKNDLLHLSCNQRYTATVLFPVTHMKALKRIASAATCAALILSTAPEALAAPDEGLTLRATQRFCNRSGARESARCQYNSRRTTGRLRIGRLRGGIPTRDNTLRDRRNAMKNRQLDNIRERGANVSRWHQRSGGRSRRNIRAGYDNVRNTCRSLRGTERNQCIRKRWVQSGHNTTE